MIDLSDIGNQDQNPLFFDYFSGNYYYSYNPCYPFTERECVNTAACQLDYSTFIYYDIGQQDSAAFSFDGLNVKISYTSQDGIRSSSVLLVCDPNAAVPTLDVQGEVGTNLYQMTVTSSAACTVPVPDHLKSGAGISAGSVLLIIFFVLLAVYLIAGAVYMKVRNQATGKDLVPNRGFWTAIPGLIADGVLCTLSICRKGSSNPKFDTL